MRRAKDARLESGDVRDQAGLLFGCEPGPVLCSWAVGLGPGAWFLCRLRACTCNAILGILHVGVGQGIASGG